MLLVFGLSGASILVVFNDFFHHARSNAGVATETYNVLFSSVILGLLGVGYQVSPRHARRTSATILGLLPVLGLTALMALVKNLVQKSHLE